MSIYSGFATRQQQETYDHCINSLLFILQKRILKFYVNEPTDEYKFTSLIQKMYLQMKQMEKSKYLDPKCSYAIQQLFQYLIKQNHSDLNATVQERSTAGLQKKSQRKRGFDEMSIQNNSQNGDILRKQKTYQIPIRTNNNKLNNNSEKKKTKNEVKNDTKTNENVGRIVSSSKSKEKSYPIMTIQHSSNVIRKRTPSAAFASRNIKNTQYVSNQKDTAPLHRSRNISYNQDTIKYPHQSQKNSTSRMIKNSFESDLLLQNQINEILQGYVAKNHRSRISSRNQSNRVIKKSLSNQKSYFTNNK